MNKSIYPTDINNSMPIIHGYRNDSNTTAISSLYDFLVPDIFSAFL